MYAQSHSLLGWLLSAQQCVLLYRDGQERLLRLALDTASVVDIDAAHRRTFGLGENNMGTRAGFGADDEIWMPRANLLLRSFLLLPLLYVAL